MGGRNRIAVPTDGDKSRYPSTSSPFMAMGRGGNSIAPVVPQCRHIARFTSVHKSSAHPFEPTPLPETAISVILFPMEIEFPWASLTLSAMTLSLQMSLFSYGNRISMSISDTECHDAFSYMTDSSIEKLKG